MRFKIDSLLMLLLLVVAMVSATTTTNEQESPSEQQQQNKMPALFDFAKYQQIFNKHYGSLVEAMVRRSYFIPRALRVVTSAVAYRFGRKDYHLAINHMSDYTSDEVKSMQNRHRKSNSNKNAIPKTIVNAINETTTLESSEDQQGDTDKRVVNASDEQLSAELKAWASDEPAVKDLLSSTAPELKRKRRSLADADDERPLVATIIRHLDLDDLISTGKNARLPRGANIRDYVPSNNPAYEPIELMSQGLADNLNEVGYYAYEDPIEEQTLENAVIRERKSVLRQHIERDRRSRKKSGLMAAKEPAASSGDHIVGVDLSLDPCMDLPRSQGQCGSCWAFTGITIFEWLYCKANNNQLVRFSEQYLVDCSAEYYAPAGCEGSGTLTMHNLVHNFGLELRKNYPYVVKEQACPLDSDSDDLSTSGYIRMEMDGYFGVPMSLWEETVHYAPLDITVYTAGSNFQDYGRGIHDLVCSDNRDSAHAMVLVGFGEENGKKYWKLRNSYGIGWGEEGYYRVSRDTKCLDYEAAAYATKDGLKYQLDRYETNENHDLQRIKAAYWDSQNAMKAFQKKKKRKGKKKHSEKDKDDIPDEYDQE